MIAPYPPFRAAPGNQYTIAHRVGWDAGNRSARAAGRAVWNDEDYAAAIAQMNALIDLWTAGADPVIEVAS